MDRSEELEIQLGFNDPTIASDSVVKLPAPTMDLGDWLADRRTFLFVQYND